MNNNQLSASHPAKGQKPAAKTAIVTDSIAQVPEEAVQQLGIYVVPFSLAVEETVHFDFKSLNLTDLYRRMRQEKDLHLVTSAPSVGQFYEAFKSCWDNGAENILYVGLSGRLSHAMAAAEEATRMLREEGEQRPVHLYDSCLATVAQGLLAIEAARLAEKGVDPETILAHLAEERKRTGFAAGLETLEYLARGGRIGKAAYMLGSAIHILPIITINNNGEVSPVGQRQGYDRLLEEILHYVKKKASGYSSITLAVMHADALPYARKLMSMAVEEFHPEEIYMTDFTPTMVAHTGPGIIGLAYHWRP